LFFDFIFYKGGGSIKNALFWISYSLSFAAFHAKKINKFLSGAMAIITIMGIVTFSLFILEESFQTVMFGTWPAQDAKRWDIVKDGVDKMRSINKIMSTVNCTVGWIQPFAFIAYGEYIKASTYYLTALDSKIFAHAPELYDGEVISTTISTASAEVNITSRGMELRVGNMLVICNEVDRSKPMKVSGVLRLLNGRPTIDMTDGQYITEAHK